MAFSRYPHSKLFGLVHYIIRDTNNDELIDQIEPYKPNRLDNRLVSIILLLFNLNYLISNKTSEYLV
jgi:hypothetical protein